MKNTPFRLGHTRELLQLWLSGQENPADVLRLNYFRERPYLGAKDRSFIDFLYFDIIRNLRLYRWQIQENGYGDAEEAEILCVHAYHTHYPEQVKDLNLKVPDTLTKLFHSYKYQTVLPEDPAILYSVPDILWQHIHKAYSSADLQACLKEFQESPGMHIRVNTLRSDREYLKQQLSNIPFLAGNISPAALRCKKYYPLEHHPLFRRGYFEFQDESSQLVSYACVPKEKDTVIDLCAGAGGKSLHLAALKKDRGQILASDISPHRMQELRRRAKRAGLTSIREMGLKELTQKFKGKADILLIDAPCSSSGVYGRHPARKWNLDAKKLREYCKTQEDLLESYCRLLKIGGALIYATCSIIPEENTLQIQKFLERHPEFRGQSLDPAFRKYGIDLPLAKDSYMRQILPQEYHSEGFFIARMQKTR